MLADFGTRLKAMGNAAEAMAKYQQAVQLCPTCAAAHYNLGVITSEQRLVSRGMKRGCGGRERGRKVAAHSIGHQGYAAILMGGRGNGVRAVWVVMCC